MPRRYGRAPTGKRCFGTWNWHERGRQNVIGALLNGKLFAIQLYDTTIKSGVFEEWCKEHLIPNLPLGSAVVMDNAKFHRKTVLPDLFHWFGHRLIFQPKYSPDLNKIENKWSGAKAYRRKHQITTEQLFCCYE